MLNRMRQRGIALYCDQGPYAGMMVVEVSGDIYLTQEEYARYQAVGGISSAPILTAISAVAPLGQVVALGVYRPALAAVIPVRTLLEKESTLRGSKAYRVSAERDDFATALGQLADCRDAYSPIITATPSWSPDDPQPPELERRNGMLKTVYVKETAGPVTARS